MSDRDYRNTDEAMIREPTTVDDATALAVILGGFVSFILIAGGVGKVLDWYARRMMMIERRRDDGEYRENSPRRDREARGLDRNLIEHYQERPPMVEEQEEERRHDTERGRVDHEERRG